MIEFKDVTKSFGERTILRNLSFSIKPGKITFVLGKSGEGKSVTIKHILGLLRPNAGDIFVSGRHVNSLEDQSLSDHRQKIGMLFQHAALFDSMSVEENILFPLRESKSVDRSEYQSRKEKVLKQIGLEGIGHKMPSELSTGEKKRVGLARAIVSKPEIILYDEPTTGMDPLVCEMIDKLIVQVNEEEQDMTSVVISHDMKAALTTADDIIMLYKGQVALQGSPDDFKNTDNPVVRQFFAGRVDGPMKLI